MANDRREDGDIVAVWHEYGDEPGEVVARPAGLGLSRTLSGQQIRIGLSVYNQSDPEECDLVGFVSLSPEQAHLLAVSLLARIPWSEGTGDLHLADGQQVMALRIVPRD